MLATETEQILLIIDNGRVIDCAATRPCVIHITDSDVDQHLGIDADDPDSGEPFAQTVCAPGDDPCELNIELAHGNLEQMRATDAHGVQFSLDALDLDLLDLNVEDTYTRSDVDEILANYIRLPGSCGELALSWSERLAAEWFAPV